MPMGIVRKIMFLGGKKMGFVIFLLIVAGIIVLIVVLKKIKLKNDLKKKIEKLKDSAGYDVAFQIKDALVQEGFEVKDMLYSGTEYNIVTAEWWFTIKSGGEEIGGMYCDDLLSGLNWRVDGLRKENTDLDRKSGRGFFYGIHSERIGLIITSKKETQEVPKFLEIAARVIQNSSYEFIHPKWMFEYPEAKKYLNVMFQ
jgi:hypothetical protein